MTVLTNKRMTVLTSRHPGTLSGRVAAEIRAELARRGSNQSQLARTLGRPPMWVSDRLRGVVALTIDDLDVIAEALDVDTVDLIAAAATIRTPDALWRRLGKVAAAAGTDRATVVRALTR